jgi:inosine-uridine nucleoside N-ribohydrolase
MTYPAVDRDALLARLEPPTGPVSMVLDTDTYNEIDDQFAVVYSLLSDNLDVEAIYAAPFFNHRSEGPGDGMHRSYAEIMRLLERMGIEGQPVYHGSERYLGAPETPVHSAAAEDLIARAMAPRDGPLYVLAIGAITNVASAILLEPAIVDRIVVVWLGGNPLYWPHSREFNLRQDVPAARVVFDCGAAVVHIPCRLVAEQLRTTLPEMFHYVKGRGAIGDYLYRIYEDFAEDHYARSKVIWDISTVAYLNDPSWVPTEVRPSPVLLDDTTWGLVEEGRHPFRTATEVHRDAVFGDLYRKLAAFAGQP